MAKPPPNVALRIIVPLAMVALGVFAFVAVLNTPSKTSANQATPNPAAATPDASPPDNAAPPPAIVEDPADTPSTGEQAPDTPAANDTNATGTRTDTPRAASPSPLDTAAGAEPDSHTEDHDYVVDLANPTAPLTPLGSFRADGSIDPESPYQLGIWFNRTGAGVDQVALTNHYRTYENKTHDRAQVAYARAERDENGLLPPGTPTLSPFTLQRIFIDGHPVSFTSGSVSLGNAWRETEPGVFVATIREDGRRAVEIERRYELEPGRYDFNLVQHVRNLTDRDLTITLEFDGPIDMPQLSTGYGGDKRRLRMGVLGPESSDPTQQVVRGQKYMTPRQSLARQKTGDVWPKQDGYTLTWAGFTNRYFGTAMHPLLGAEGAAAALPDKAFHLVDTIELPDAARGARDGLPPILRVRTVQRKAQAGQTADFSLGVYAGPLDKKVIREDRELAAVGMDELVMYSFGGPCAFCTFQWLTLLLKGFLTILHNYLVFDWALAIILLVVCVRTILHPITKFSQVRMHRFTKQLQGLQPKQQKLQERYKDDPAKLRQEMARLFQEEHVQFSGALGCLPMFLQTPVWIALYAMLYFAFELRHEPAFFGVIQQLTGGWSFLADLAEPDHFIYLPGKIHFTLPLMGTITGINLLPLLLGVVFYTHQKYLTPPPSATMTPEQKQTQGIMRVMMVVMFPLFMYNAPSGLTLYFITNSTLGIVESRHIRAHAEKLWEAEQKNPRSRRKKTGLMARLQAAAEQRQRQVAEAKGQVSRRGDAPRQTGLGQTRGRNKKRKR